MGHKLSGRVQRLPPSKFAEIKRLMTERTDVIRLELGEPDFNTPKHVKEAAIKAIDEGFTHYTSSEGLLELRARVAKPARAFYIYPRILVSMESTDFVKFLMENAKVAVMPGTAFSMKGEEYVRISYANSIEKISEAMDRIQKLVSQITKP